MQDKNLQWTEEIKAKHSLFELNLKEVWQYRDLLFMLVKRDFVTFYKQTILGPLWFFVQPILTTVMFLFVFGKLAKLSTDGVPQVAFYLAGITIWNYFSDGLNKTATVFNANAHIFGKVYFPRLIMPLSIVTSNLLKLFIQFVLFLGVVFYYWLYAKQIHPNSWAFALPFLILLLACLALGLGMIFSSLTTKYRDLTFLLSFGVQLFMYATPVIYPYSTLSGNLKTLISYNPLTGIFECFRYGFLGTGHFSFILLMYSTIIVVIILLLGTIVFNKVEKDFIDTV